MENIKIFFNNLKRDIKNSRTKKALALLEKRLSNYVGNFRDATIKINIKKYVYKEYRKSLKLISKMKRIVKD